MPSCYLVTDADAATQHGTCVLLGDIPQEHTTGKCPFSMTTQRFGNRWPQVLVLDPVHVFRSETWVGCVTEHEQQPRDADLGSNDHVHIANMHGPDPPRWQQSNRAGTLWPSLH